MRKRRSTGRKADLTSQVRIIGGSHRGRLVRFVEAPGLRPTGNRVRETLFNWLQPTLPGARVLDLFAGSGALGFEAASRGAGEVLMLESSARVAGMLQAAQTELQLPGVRIEQADSLAFLANDSVVPRDLVLVDPPFAQELLASVCSLLDQRGWLSPGALIYLEQNAGDFPELPKGWHCLRSKQSGQVAYGLWRHEAP